MVTQNEPEWFRLACAFANEFREREGGRDYFHAISQFYPRYDPEETNKKFNLALNKNYGNIRIGTFMRLAAWYGIKLN